MILLVVPWHPAKTISDDIGRNEAIAVHSSHRRRQGSRAPFHMSQTNWMKDSLRAGSAQQPEELPPDGPPDSAEQHGQECGLTARLTVQNCDLSCPHL